MKEKYYTDKCPVPQWGFSHCNLFKYGKKRVHRVWQQLCCQMDKNKYLCVFGFFFSGTEEAYLCYISSRKHTTAHNSHLRALNLLSQRPLFFFFLFNRSMLVSTPYSINFLYTGHLIHPPSEIVPTLNFSSFPIVYLCQRQKFWEEHDPLYRGNNRTEKTYSPGTT